MAYSSCQFNSCDGLLVLSQFLSFLVTHICLPWSLLRELLQELPRRVLAKESGKRRKVLVSLFLRHLVVVDGVQVLCRSNQSPFWNQAQLSCTLTLLVLADIKAFDDITGYKLKVEQLVH